MLYLLKSGNYLKIGYAKNIEERMKLYTTHNPDFELLDTAEGTLLDEKELHKVCKRWQHRTEWYDYNEEVIKIFKEFTTRNKSEVIFKFLIIKEENSEVEIIDICKDYRDAESYILSKYNGDKSVYRIYYLGSTKICIYPDKIIQEQKSKIEELTKKLPKLSKISKLNEIAKLEEKSIEESELISKPTSELKGLTWIVEKLKELSKYEYTYDELKNIFEPLFKEHNLKWDKNTSIKIFFPEFEKTRKQIKGNRSTMYKFK